MKETKRSFKILGEKYKVNDTAEAVITQPQNSFLTYTEVLALKAAQPPLPEIPIIEYETHKEAIDFLLSFHGARLK